jgi:hypothetical protein
MVRVALGQKVLLPWIATREVFDAIVGKIYPIMDERSRTFMIEAFVKPQLYPNLTASEYRHSDKECDYDSKTY